MIIRSDRLFKLTNNNRIQEIFIELSQHDYTKNYVIIYYTNIYKKKMICRPTIHFDKYEVDLANQTYNKKLATYLGRGYKLMGDITNCSYDKLTEEILYKALNKQPYITTGTIPLLTNSVDCNQCHSSTLNKEGYVTPMLGGIKVAVYMKDNIIHATTMGNYSCDVVLKPVLKDKGLVKYFKDYPQSVLDCRIYRHNINFNYDVIMAIVRKGIYTKRAKGLQLWITDVVLKEKIDKRIEHLEDIRNNYVKDSELVRVSTYKYSNCVSTIYNMFYKYVDQGYNGILFKRKLTNYGMGMRRSDFCIHMNDVKFEQYQIVGTNVKNDRLYFIIRLHNKENLEIPVQGEPEDHEHYIKIKELYVYKMAVVQYTTKENNILKHPIAVYVYGGNNQPVG